MKHCASACRPLIVVHFFPLLLIIVACTTSSIPAFSLHQRSQRTQHRHAREKHKPLWQTRRRDQQQSRTSPESSSRRSELPGRSALDRPSARVQLDYARNGHAVLRQFLPSELVQELELELVQYCHDHALSAWQQKVELAVRGRELPPLVGSTIPQCQQVLRKALGASLPIPFLQFFNLWRGNNAVYSLACQLAETASILMDIPEVRLYQDALFWKQKGRDGITPWHVDARMAPFDTTPFLTFWIPLHNIVDSGLVFCSKSHVDIALPYWHPLTKERVLDSSSPWYSLEDRYSTNNLVDYLPLYQGDVTVHSGWTLHCADPVQASRDRFALAISFVDARAPIRKKVAVRNRKSTHSSNYGDDEDTWSYKDWINDVPRESHDWDHDLVPILWPRLVAPKRRPRDSSGRKKR